MRAQESLIRECLTLIFFYYAVSLCQSLCWTLYIILSLTFKVKPQDDCFLAARKWIHQAMNNVVFSGLPNKPHNCVTWLNPVMLQSI